VHRVLSDSALWLTVGSLTAALSCTSGAASDDGEATESTSGDTPTALQLEATVESHEAQPMVVDLVVAPSEAAEIGVVHPEDPGVRVTELSAGDPAGERRFRIRGLRPGSDHRVLVTGRAEDDGEVVELDVPFTTDPPLDGFVAAFPLGEFGTVEDQVYRLADLSGFDGPQGAVLIDAMGITRWYWGTTLSEGGLWNGVSLRDDGTLLYATPAAVEIRDELGALVQRVTAEQLGLPAFHHDVIELPDGHFMALSYEFERIDYGGTEGILSVFGDVVVEFDLEGTVAWEWHAFDHLDPQRRTDGFFNGYLLLDPVTGEVSHDWTHGNGLVYAEADGVLLLSMRHQDWVVAIDHGSADGDVLWRLGPDGDFTLAGADAWFYTQHSPQWQPDGTLLLYDNAAGNPATPPGTDPHSRARRFELDMGAMVATERWRDDGPPVYSELMGDSDRMPGGNVLILDSTIDYVPGQSSLYSRLRELDPGASPMQQWSIQTPTGRFMYRATPVERMVGVAAP
jgi:hypothetical protein